MFSFFFISLLLTVGTEKALAKEDTKTSTPASTKPLQCGVSSQPISEDPKDEGKVTSGQFPWVAAIYTKDNGTWIYTCSGTLISEHIVVTAAHCLQPPEEDTIKPEDIKVGLGKLNYYFESNETGSIMADVKEVVISNRFNGPNANYAFDLALVDLTVSVKPTPQINPACLLGEATADINLDGKGYVVAWTDNKNETQSSKVAFFYPTICMQKLPSTVYQRYLSPDKMCAELIKGTDADRGSGGAGLTVDIQGAHYVIGALSTKVPSLFLLTNMKNEDVLKWVKTEKTRLDGLH